LSEPIGDRTPVRPIWDLRFSRQWPIHVLWRHMDLQVDTRVSGEHAHTIVRIALVSTDKSTRRYIPEYLHLHLDLRSPLHGLTIWETQPSVTLEQAPECLWIQSRRFSTGVPRDVARGSARDRDRGGTTQKELANKLAKINRSTEKYHSLLERALAIIIGLLYLKLTDYANVPWAVDIIIFMQGFPETWKLFQGFLQGKKIEKGWSWGNLKMM
jgi:hypothetical protein